MPVTLRQLQTHPESRLPPHVQRLQRPRALRLIGQALDAHARPWD